MTMKPLTRTLAHGIALALSVPCLAQANLDSYVFSLDIGSDTEISDPAGGAGELADPGDVYQSSSVAGSLSGAPFVDDFNLFGGTDPAPQQGVVASAAPVGNPAVPYSDFFDLDGYDAVDVRIDQLDINPQSPLQAPLWRQNLQIDCVAEARYLAVSFNDDDITGWRAPNPPRVPTEGPSPFGAVHGTIAGQDEVVALELSLAGGLPAAVLSYVPTATETTVHVDLGPNPPAEADDDDVDALDKTDLDACAIHLFSADNEGRLNLNPGIIYQRAAGAGPTPVITSVHTGLPATADIDAFELAWLPHPSNQQQALALLSSVDPDDPATAIDESGGQSPTTIYASFLTGGSFVLVPGPPNGFDDVDAIATSTTPVADSDGDGIPNPLDNCTLVPNPSQRDTDGDGYGNVCDTDLDNNCITNAFDLAIFRNRFFTADPDADFNGNGIVNAGDLSYMRQNFFLPPGPSGYATLCP